MKLAGKTDVLLATVTTGNEVGSFRDVTAVKLENTEGPIVTVLGKAVDGLEIFDENGRREVFVTGTVITIPDCVMTENLSVPDDSVSWKNTVKLDGDGISSILR